MLDDVSGSLDRSVSERFGSLITKSLNRPISKVIPNVGLHDDRSYGNRCLFSAPHFVSLGS